jgi:hypothetical protein
MLVLGGVFLFTFIGYEMFFAKLPLMPKRIIFNRGFLGAVLIDFFYFVSLSVRSSLCESLPSPTVGNTDVRDYEIHLSVFLCPYCEKLVRAP